MIVIYPAVLFSDKERFIKRKVRNGWQAVTQSTEHGRGR